MFLLCLLDARINKTLLARTLKSVLFTTTRKPESPNVVFLIGALKYLSRKVLFSWSQVQDVGSAVREGRPDLTYRPQMVQFFFF